MPVFPAEIFEQILSFIRFEIDDSLDGSISDASHDALSNEPQWIAAYKQFRRDRVAFALTCKDFTESALRDLYVNQVVTWHTLEDPQLRKSFDRHAEETESLFIARKIRKSGWSGGTGEDFFRRAEWHKLRLPNLKRLCAQWSNLHVNLFPSFDHLESLSLHFCELEGWDDEPLVFPALKRLSWVDEEFSWTRGMPQEMLPKLEELLLGDMSKRLDMTSVLADLLKSSMRHIRRLSFRMLIDKEAAADGALQDSGLVHAFRAFTSLESVSLSFDFLHDAWYEDDDEDRSGPRIGSAPFISLLKALPNSVTLERFVLRDMSAEPDPHWSLLKVASELVPCVGRRGVKCFQVIRRGPGLEELDHTEREALQELCSVHKVHLVLGVET